MVHAHSEQSINANKFFLELLPQYNTDEIKKDLFEELVKGLIESCHEDIRFEEYQQDSQWSINAAKNRADNVFKNFVALFDPFGSVLEPKIKWLGTQGQFVFFLEIMSHHKFGITNPVRNYLSEFKYEYAHKYFTFKEQPFSKKSLDVARSYIKQYLEGNQIKDPANKLPSREKMQKVVDVLNAAFRRKIVLPEVNSYNKNPPTIKRT